MNNAFEGYGIFRVRYENHEKDSMEVGDKTQTHQDPTDDSALPTSKDAADPEASKLQEDVYEGEWRNSLKHGNGTEKYCNGDYYIGHFREGEFDGTGKYIWSNGSTYSG